jgi:hypothetical protein
MPIIFNIEDEDDGDVDDDDDDDAMKKVNLYY